MILQKLKLMNFRNYASLDIEFSPEINFITGDNGSGKTNIIEAVSIISNLKSFRNTSDSHIVKWGNNSYYCSGVIEGADFSKFEVGFITDNEKIKKKIKIDGSEIKKASDYYGKFVSVLFIPGDINIISGTPEIRRKYFDSVISKIYPEYIDELNEFKSVLNSRNIVLKKIREGRSGINELEVWNRLFSEKSFLIIKRRESFIEMLNKYFNEIYLMISGEPESPVIKYLKSGVVNPEDFYKNLLKNIRDDLKKGNTGSGPQRDDYLFLNSDRINFNNYASQGQRRTASICLKMSEFEIIRDIKQKKSIILVDDIFSELDENRRGNMIDLLKSKGQLIFTMVNADFIKSGIQGNVKIFSVDKGKVK